MKILHVDDSNLIRTFFSACVTAMAPDSTLVQAENGFAAEAALRQERFDVVILDLSMPGMDEIELLRRIRPLAGNTPLILASGAAIGEVRNLGGDDYFLKTGASDWNELLRKAFRLAREPLPAGLAAAASQERHGYTPTELLRMISTRPPAP